MSEQADRAANIEQRYVEEYDEVENVVEGLDPDLPESRQTTEQVKAVAPDGDTAAEVDRMADHD